MTNRSVRSISFFSAAVLFYFGYTLIALAGDITVSPISLSANTPGVEVTQKTLERWSAQTELSLEQMAQLDLKPGIMDEALINKLTVIGEDAQSKKFVDFIDSMVQFRNDRTQQTAGPDLSSSEPWRTLLTVDQFYKDVAAIGGFDDQWVNELRTTLTTASKSGAANAQVSARNLARVKLFEARQRAVKRAKSYRHLADLIRRETEGREVTKNIAMVVEVRSGARQPTIATRSEVTMECEADKSREKAPTLQFVQRKRECNDAGVCKVESIADISKGADYEYVYSNLMTGGRAYLDTCKIKTRMFIDGENVDRSLPGNFTTLDQKTPPAAVSIWKVAVDVDPQTGKYSVEGTVFGIGDPVHELLTLKALVDSGYAKEGAASKDPNIVQIMRGVFWNDDPCAQLFTENDFKPLQPSFGATWYVDFSKAGKDKSGEYKQLSCPLLGRSHYGDMQFLHGMADREGVVPSETSSRVLAWASIMYRIALGQLDAEEPLDPAAVGKTLPGDIAKRKPMELFRAKTVNEVRERALGSLLHLIQDSYAHGHIKRELSADGHDGPIVQFLYYKSQNSSRHAHDDKWSSEGIDLERTLAIPGARDALQASTAIVRFYKDKKPWADVEKYLMTVPLTISAKAVNSGPGEDYK